MEMLKEYFALQEKIHDYFGYKEDWKVIPLVDDTEMFWFVEECEDEDGYSGSVSYAESIADLDSDGEASYMDDIYTQRFLPKFVFRGEDYTMISCDPHVDGNKFLRVFDNAKEVNPETWKLVRECSD